MLLPRQAGEADLERTVVLWGAHSDSDAFLFDRMDGDPNVADTKLLLCDTPLNCTVTSADTDDLGNNTKIAVGIAIALILIGVVSVCVVAYICLKKRKVDVFRFRSRVTHA
jgi:hypothetical protein